MKTIGLSHASCVSVCPQPPRQDNDQMRKAALADMKGLPMEREFRAAIAATGRLEGECLARVGQLLREPDMWRAMPTKGLCVQKNALAFRMVSRMGCCVHQLVAVPHTQMPTKMFRVLADPASASEVAATPTCMQDAWSANFLAEHGKDLLSAKSLAILTTLAYPTAKDISQLESKHASIRRWLLLRSHQTHTMDFKDLSAEWVLQRTRKCPLIQGI